MAERCGILGSLEHRFCVLPILQHSMKFLLLPLRSRDAAERMLSDRAVRPGVK